MQIMSLPTSIIAYCTLIVAALLLGAYAYVKRESLGSQRIAISAPPHLAGTVRDGPVASAPALEIALISSESLSGKFWLNFVGRNELYAVR